MSNVHKITLWVVSQNQKPGLQFQHKSFSLFPSAFSSFKSMFLFSRSKNLRLKLLVILKSHFEFLFPFSDLPSGAYLNMALTQLQYTPMMEARLHGPDLYLRLKLSLAQLMVILTPESLQLSPSLEILLVVENFLVHGYVFSHYL